MSGKYSRNKGKRGERQVIDAMLPVVQEVYAAYGLPEPQLKRNTMQADRGGTDIAGLDFLAIEVKNQETEALGAWWAQCLAQCGQHQTPVLLFKRNRIQWRCMLFATLGGARQLTVPAIISMEDFLIWLRARLSEELSKRL